MYRHYGARGITVDPRWENFQNFLADMGERPEGMTLDRIDPDKGYSLDNCRWADWDTQVINRRSTKHFATYEGRTQTLADWSKETGISYSTLRHRIANRGWSAERALTTPPLPTGPARRS